jgi:hypothetical protein
VPVIGGKADAKNQSGHYLGCRQHVDYDQKIGDGAINFAEGQTSDQSVVCASAVKPLVPISILECPNSVATQGEDMRKRFLVIGIGILLQMIFVIAQDNRSLATNANKPCPKLGYCPAGSCAEDGTTRACNTKNCSPQHCHH